MTSARTRERLIERLKAEGVRDVAVLDRIRARAAAPVRRRGAREPCVRGHAAADRLLQTISQPLVVALMTEALIAGCEGKKITKVLEIGTGSGYQTAVLAPFVQHIYSVERIQPLVQRARMRLAELKIGNVSVRHADGWLGWKSQAPFQGILVAAAPERIPPSSSSSSTTVGDMIIPIGAQPARAARCRSSCA